MIPTKKIRVSRRLLISKTQLVAFDAALARHGYGSGNAFPLVLNSTTSLLKSADDEIDSYLIDFSQMDSVMFSIIQRLISQHAPATTVRTEDVSQLLTEKVAKRQRDRYEYSVDVVIRANRRTQVISRLVTAGYPAANTQFFLQGLSLSGSAPIQAYLDSWKLDRSFRDEIKFLADNAPTSELWISAKNEEALSLARTVFDSQYQSDDSVNRTKARVRVVDTQPTQQEILTLLNLKIV